jgi:hypothetical protein
VQSLYRSSDLQVQLQYDSYTCVKYDQRALDFSYTANKRASASRKEIDDLVDNDQVCLG